MRVTRVYTRGGDTGKTHLVGGARVAKDALRVCAYGEVDELSAVIGVIRCLLPSDGPLKPASLALSTLADELFMVGSEMATPVSARWPQMQRVGSNEIDRLERWIDDMSAQLPPLTEFILPGGGEAGAQLHLARTVCRRAERSTVLLNSSEDAELLDVIRYLNRLSDLLFVLARWVGQVGGHEEVRWNKAPKQHLTVFAQTQPH